MYRIILLSLLISFVAISVAGAGTAPDLTATDLDGNPVMLDQLMEDNELVILTFWLPGCSPCNTLLDYSQAFQDEYAADGLATFVVYSYCEPDLEQTRRFMERRGITLPVLVDRDDAISDAFEVCCYPHLVITGRDRDIIWSNYGYCCGDEVCIQALIHRELRETELLWNEIINLDE